MTQRLLELKLLSQCALADNRQAFGRLVEMYSPALRGFLLNLTKGDAALTDDLAQETFIKAYLGIRSFQSLSRFSTWLYRIAYNEYVSYLRRRREEALQEGFDIADTPTDPEDDRLPEVMREIDGMSEPMHTIILLFYNEDKPIKEISSILGIPVNTVKVYLKRGRDRLKQKLSATTI